MIHNEAEARGSVFTRRGWVAVLALTAAIAWGWAYPLIKMGFGEFHITSEMTGSKMLFAGIRFMLSGLIILAIAGGARRRFVVADSWRGWAYVVAFALVNTTLHYAFFYFGLSHSEGARAAILNSLSVFAVVIMACVMFKSDRLTASKIVGCVLGFAGIMALNIGGGESGSFTWLGDGLIIMNALCGATASLMTRGLSRRVDVFVGTGYSLALGGALLVVPGVAVGGTLPVVTVAGVVILLLLTAISTIGFTLYNKLLSCNPIGRVAIFNSLIPVVGAVTSCLCLGEEFYWKYVVAGGLAAAGIFVINRGKR